jgi:hypothetical protein
MQGMARLMAMMENSEGVNMDSIGFFKDTNGRE